MRLLVFVASLLIVQLNFSQQTSSTLSEVEEALNEKVSMAKNSLVKNVPLENIGPSVMSGRVVDIDSAGIWHTKTNGISFTPILDNSQTQNVGEIAIDWVNNIIWVGTGENNSSRSSYLSLTLKMLMK